MGRFQKHCWCVAFALLILFEGASAQQQFIPTIIRTAQLSNTRLTFLRNPFPIENKIILQWSYSGSRLPEYFVIERSTDERHFKTIAVVRPEKSLDIFEFADEGASGGQSYYRVKAEGCEEPEIVSAVIGAESMAISCKIYPNPVENILIIRSDISGIVQLKDLQNNCRLTADLQKGLQHIDVSALYKGIYIVTLFDKRTNKTFRQRLVKH